MAGTPNPLPEVDLSKRVITVEELAAVLRIARRTAYTRVARGEYEAIRVGHQWRIPTAPIRALLGAD